MVVADRDEATATETAQTLASAGRHSLAVHTDVGTAEDRRRSIDAAIDAWQRLDVLINNAGIVRVHRPNERH